jgi:predicted metalloprotease
MRWRSGRRSSNIDDRRGRRVTRRGAAGGGLGVLVLALAAIYFGVDPSVVLQNVPSTGTVTTERVPVPAGQEELSDFVSVILADTEDTWRELFAGMGGAYREPTLVLFNGTVESACGIAGAATGPFYCPRDHKVYIDLSFYRDLKERFRAPGDFAQAYVIAHEIGHHVQNLLGILGEVHASQQRVGKAEANALSVRAELQADCLAGVWANRANRSRNILEEGDVEEGLNAAAAIGDDRIQKQSRGYVVPDAFTHGSSEQRMRWFRRGLEEGDMNRCDTFRAAAL